MMKMEVTESGLIAPEGYSNLTPKNKAEICNGCGPKGKLDFIPDRIWGLKITEACDIHDFSWFICEMTHENFKMTNRIFYQNILRLIDRETNNRTLKWLRRRRAYKYYKAVDTIGSMIFWNMERGNT